MTDTTSPDPIFVTMWDAAHLLSTTPVAVADLCELGELDAQFDGERRLIRYASVVAYADRLPRDRQVSA